MLQYLPKLYCGGGYNNKVRIIRHSNNRGLGAARNTGIKNARGEYIYFVDSDDAIIPDALEKLHNAAKISDADVIHVAGWYEINQDDDKPLDAKNVRLRREQHNHEGFLKSGALYRLNECFVSDKFWPMAWLNMCRREFLEEADLKFLDIISEDVTFSFALYCRANRYYVLNDTIYGYRKRENSIMKSYDTARFSRGVHALLVGSQYIKELMDSVPELAYNRDEQEKMMQSFFDAMLVSHAMPFYSDGKMSVDLDNKVFEEFLPVFKENTTLVKYLFHSLNVYLQRFTVAVQQNQLLVNQLQRSQIIISAAQQKVVPNKIVFVNFFGNGYGCNPKYIAEEIIRRNLPYDLVWFVDNLNMPMPPKIRKVLFNSADAIAELSTAKVIITNIKNALPFVKKPNQYMIMTWHGDGGTKYVEAEVENKLSPQYVAESKANSAITDLMLAGSESQFEVMRRAFWYNGEIAKFGIPRNDIFFNSTDEFKSKIRASLGIPSANKIVIYSPTFRDDPSVFLDVYKLDYEKLRAVMKERFGGEWTVLVRFHPNISRMNFANSLFTPTQNIIDVTQYPDMQELLVISDVAISDYSSSPFEFALMNKPAFIFARDFDTYTGERGLRPMYFKPEYTINKTEDELFHCIATFDPETLKNGRSEYLKALRPYDDGHASERVVDRIKAVIDGSFKGA